MNPVGTASSSNAVSNTDDYAVRLKGRRTADTGLAAKPDSGIAASAQPSAAASFPVSAQAGIRLSGDKLQEFRPYDGRVLSNKIKAEDGAVSEGGAGETGRGNNSPQAGNDPPPPGNLDRSTDGASALPVDAKQEQSAVVPGEKKLDDPQVQQAVAQLRSIEEKVKAHEAAHKGAGGTMTGPVSYSYTRGPDGKNYITGGEVPISISPGNTPQETISRMQQVIHAALAPADPSPQDRAVAAQAASIAQNASQEKAEAESQVGDSKDAAGDSGEAAVVQDNGADISVRNKAGEGDEAIARVPDSAATASERSSQSDAVSVTMDVGEERSASGKSDKDFMERISRQAYSDPAVAGVNTTPENASSMVDTINPQSITGFGPARPFSLYA